jgi:hypothetical protein
LDLEKWQATIKRMQSLGFSHIAPTHFDIFDDAAWHLAEIARSLDAVNNWLEKVMPSDPPIEELRENFSAWMYEQGREKGLSAEAIRSFELANPLGMSADGLQRYWQKTRLANNGPA